ncbi:uncharacterized protein QC763_705240 [Podospora pseudopauciseta]|uniref:Uncharacterized protein n=1 Tax=Podospora pseudopauciseta TaxID=2093780 RepID=A0ABR0H0U7_9PEZI|nr:hypothetical protein QC763_705240 [Podospora pseudopauciseta]
MHGFAYCRYPFSPLLIVTEAWKGAPKDKQSLFSSLKTAPPSTAKKINLFNKAAIPQVSCNTKNSSVFLLLYEQTGHDGFAPDVPIRRK